MQQSWCLATRKGERLQNAIEGGVTGVVMTAPSTLLGAAVRALGGAEASAGGGVIGAIAGATLTGSTVDVLVGDYVHCGIAGLQAGDSR